MTKQQIQTLIAELDLIAVKTQDQFPNLAQKARNLCVQAMVIEQVMIEQEKMWAFRKKILRR